MSAPLLELSGISKSFGTTKALDDVSFNLEPGEVHALVGENGAGKSTLLGILSGVIVPDQGSIALDGTVLTLGSPAAAQAVGIGMVFQELSIAGSLSVAENVYAGRLPTSFGRVRWAELRRRAREVLAPFADDIDVDVPVDHLPVGQRQVVEIAKALSLDSRILLLDEPTSALAAAEVSALFRIIRQLKQGGIGIIYVSHHLTEVFRIADRVTVLRDGCKITTRVIPETSLEQVILDMVGRQLIAPGSVMKATRDERVLIAHGLGRWGEFSAIDLTLFSGEVLGLAGLIGARRSELARTLAGILPFHAGSMELRGRQVCFESLREAMRQGIAYIPDDRKTEGLFLTRSVTENIIVTDIARFSRLGVLDKNRSRAAARAATEAFHIKAPGLTVTASHLSGGNQQKLMLSKWLAADPSVFIMDSPTKGVDIGSKGEIHREIRRLAAAGKAVLIVSSDLPELMAVTDRIIVMREGRIVGERETRSANEEQIMALAASADPVSEGEAA